MSHSKLAIVSILCVVVLLGVYIARSNTNTTPPTSSLPLRDIAATSSESNQVAVGLPPTSQTTAAPILPLTKNPVSSQRATDAMWRTTDLPQNPPQVRADVPDLELYTIAREKFVAARPGDKLTIPLPNVQAEVELWVETAYKNPSGSLTLMGKVNGYHDYSFTMTLGHKSTFATIGTTQGVFNLRGDNRHVWAGLGKSFNHHVDPTQPDYRVVPQI